MAKTVAKLVGAAVLAVLLGSTAATSAERPTVVVRLSDYARLSADMQAEVQAHVAQVYARAGVSLEWLQASQDTVCAHEHLCVEVVILDARMTDRLEADPHVFGRASRDSRRAYVYFPRVLTHVMTRGGITERALAAVMAHELGHVLLPEYSHAPTGLMRARWNGPLTRVPDFTTSQAESIRLEASVARRALPAADSRP
jgi:hypothetical protein